MPDIAEIQIKVVNSGVKEARDNLKDLNKAAKDTTGMLGLLGKAIPFAALGFMAKSFIESSSAATDLYSRLRLLTGSVGQTEAVIERLQSVAFDFDGDIENLTETFLALGGGFKDAGLSAADTADFIEGLNNALILSGSSGENAATVLSNLGRAMASGVLSGNELNMILERGGRVTELLAEEFGTTAHGLREIGREGRITAEVVHKALVGNLELLREEVEEMPRTLRDVFKRVGTATDILADRFDKAFGRESSLPNGINSIAEELIKFADDAEKAGYITNAVVVKLGDAFSNLFTSVTDSSSSTTEDITGDVEDWGLATVKTIDAIVANWATYSRAAMDILTAHGNAIIALFRWVSQQADAIWEGSFKKQRDATDRLAAEIRRNEAIVADAINPKNLQASIDNMMANGATKLYLDLLETAKAAKETIDDTKGLKKGVDELNGTMEKGSESINQNAKALADLREKLYQATLSSEELLKRQATLSLNDYASKSQVANIEALAVALAKVESSNRARDVMSDLREEIFQVGMSAENLLVRQAALSIGEYVTVEQITSIQALVRELTNAQEAVKAGDAFDEMMKGILDIDPTQSDAIRSLEREYNERLQIIANSMEYELQTTQQYEEALLKVREDYASRRTAILEKEQSEQEQATIQTAANIAQITSSQISSMKESFAEGSAMGRAFFFVQQSIAAANSVIQGLSAGMAIRAAYASLGMVGSGIGEAHAKMVEGMGFVNAGLIMGQTLSFDGGGYTGNGVRSGGLDGKGGFMAMLHPRETVIDHTRGQGGGSVNIAAINVTIKEKEGQSSQEQAKQIGKAIEQQLRGMVTSEIVTQQRPGNILNPVQTVNVF